eukprot:GHVP01047608.1.p1 GENE.GHVP01047608.1~~GHVP01047608.1.p1  ORF type:complete len:1156 (+),score=160.62 GHVP01047608.1:113-3580(+)
MRDSKNRDVDKKLLHVETLLDDSDEDQIIKEQVDSKFIEEIGYKKISPPNPQSNFITTARYSLYGFIFQHTLEELIKPVTIYSLSLCFLQSIPQISLTGGYPTMLVPLFIVLLLSTLIDGLVDYQRHLSDRSMNDKHVYQVIFKNGRFAGVIKTKSSSLKEGDLILVKNREKIPADVLLLMSSHPEGRVLVETSSMDGESNLKIRTPPVDIVGCGLEKAVSGGTLDAIYQLILEDESKKEYFIDDMNLEIKDPLSNGLQSIQCTVEPPSLGLFDCNFRGNLKFKADQRKKEVSYFGDYKSVLYRECTVRNTSWCFGMVIYTGKDTKVMQNAVESRAKISNVDRMWNDIFLFLIGFLVIVGVTYASLSARHFARGSFPIYLPKSDKSITVHFVKIISSWAVMLASLIPISMTVQSNICRGFQTYQVHSDCRFNIDKDKRPVVRNPLLLGELGQISNIFSDKTGTLTKNLMTLKTLMIGGQSFGDQESQSIVFPYVKLNDPSLNNAIHQKKNKEYILFALSMAINHSVFCAEEHEESSCGKFPSYSASSMDEGALVYGAASLEITFLGAAGRFLNISLGSGLEVQIEIHTRFEFTSERKRSSTIATIPAIPEYGFFESQSYIFCKGADTILEDLCLETPTGFHISQEVETLSRLGFRTLCFAMKSMTQDEVSTILQSLLEAGDDDDATENIICKAESDLLMTGCAGIEDELQEFVPETIEALQEAGIKICLLTGDKFETTLNISSKIGLITDSMETFIFDPEVLLEKQLADTVAALDKGCNVAVVIEGGFLNEFLSSHSQHVGDIFLKASTLIFCRVTPAQKALVVSKTALELKNSRSSKLPFWQGKSTAFGTLAVGDGGNDCSMITTADVGVGIKGNEGSQAFNCSDFGISSFYHLALLLLHHGRNNYRRDCIFQLSTIYKSMVYNTPQILRGAVSLFAAERFFPEILNQLFNQAFSAVAPLAVVAFDSDLPRIGSSIFPNMYADGLNNRFLNFTVFIKWFLSGIIHGIYCFLIPSIFFGGKAIINSSGNISDMWIQGLCCLICVLAVIHMRFLEMSKSTGILVILGEAISLLLLSFVIGVLPYLKNTFKLLCSSHLFPISVFAVLLCCFHFDLLVYVSVMYVFIKLYLLIYYSTTILMQYIILVLLNYINYNILY